MAAPRLGCGASDSEDVESTRLRVLGPRRRGSGGGARVDDDGDVALGAAGDMRAVAAISGVLLLAVMLSEFFVTFMLPRRGRVSRPLRRQTPGSFRGQCGGRRAARHPPAPGRARAAEPSNRTRKSKGLADEPVQSQAQVEGIEHT